MLFQLITAFVAAALEMLSTPVQPPATPAPQPAAHHQRQERPRVAERDQPAPAAKPAAPVTGEADQIVDEVQKFYQQTPQLTAKFRQTSTNNTFATSKQNDGWVYLKRPGKMRWDYASKRDARLVSRSMMSDGNVIWAVMNDDKQYYTQDLKDNALPVAVTFLTGKGDLKKEFSASIDTSGRFGDKGDRVLKLLPRKPSTQFKELYLAIDPTTHRVKESVVVNDAETNRYRFYEPDTSKAIPDTVFVFNPKAPAAKGFRQIKPQQQGQQAAQNPATP